MTIITIYIYTVLILDELNDSILTLTDCAHESLISDSPVLVAVSSAGSGSSLPASCRKRRCFVGQATVCWPPADELPRLRQELH